jgi:serine protease Do
VTVDPGVVVAEVFPDTPAAAAGLARGDLILAVGGREVFTGPELRDAVHAAPDGDQVALRIRRGKASRELATRLAAPTDAATPAGGDRLGATVDPGVVVAEVLPDGPAAAKLAPGDLILAVNDVPVLSGDELHDALLDAPSGADVHIRVGRGGTVREVPIRLA